jgi:hypothetical protein
LPLARVEFVEKSAVHTVQHAALQVELVGGRRISVSSGFDAASLTRLIAVLEQRKLFTEVDEEAPVVLQIKHLLGHGKAVGKDGF